MASTRWWPAGERKKQPVKIGGVVIGWVTRDVPERYLVQHAATDKLLGFVSCQHHGVLLLCQEHERRSGRKDRKVQRP